MTEATVLSKLKKLFALADPSRNANENEVLLALERAKRLMAEHNLAMADVLSSQEEAEQPTTKIVEEQAYLRRGNVSLKKWEHWLAATVAKLTSTRNLRRNWTGQKVVVITFIGTEQDVAIAKALFIEMRKTTLAWARKRLGSGYTPSHRNYCEGFVMRLWERASTPVEDLTKQQQQTVALAVRTKDALVSAFVQSMNVRQARHSTTNGAQDDYARSQGYHDARSIDMSHRNRLTNGEDD